jgi:hypothetical protein
MTPTFKYQSGEEIMQGDQVTFHGEPGEIEFVAEQLVGDPAMDWYVQELGGGVMILNPKVSGRTFMHDTEEAEDLVFVSRKRDAKGQAGDRSARRLRRRRCRSAGVRVSSLDDPSEGNRLPPPVDRHARGRPTSCLSGRSG